MITPLMGELASLLTSPLENAVKTRSFGFRTDKSRLAVR
jgi:hypothetical protein